jgi:hypothetical protein
MLIKFRHGPHRNHRSSVDLRAVVYLCISWSLPSNESACHNTEKQRTVFKYTLIIYYWCCANFCKYIADTGLSLEIKSDEKFYTDFMLPRTACIKYEDRLKYNHMDSRRSLPLLRGKVLLPSSVQQEFFGIYVTDVRKPMKHSTETIHSCKAKELSHSREISPFIKPEYLPPWARWI